MKRVTLPPFLTRTDFPEILDRLRVSETVDDRLVVDWSDVRFSDPAGHVIVAAYVVTETRDGTDIEFEGFDPAGYRARMRIQEVCGLPDEYPFARRNPDDRFTEVERLRDESESADFAQRAVEVLRVAEPVQDISFYSLREILTNVHEHTFSPCNAIGACQFYHDLRDGTPGVVYAVADMGPGIPSEVRQIEPVKTAAEAVDLAMEPGFSTAADRRANPGLGLTVARAVATRTGGTLRVVTDDVVVRYREDGAWDQTTVGWKGTVVAGTIPAEPGTTLEDVLGEIRDSTTGRGA